MSYHWIVPLAAALATLALAIFVQRRGPRTPLRSVFTFGAIALSFWNLIYVVFYGVADRDLAFTLARIVRSGAMFLFPAVLHLILILPDRPRRPILWRVLWIDYALFIILVIANAFDLLVSDLRVVQWGYYSVGTPLYDLFTILVLLNFAAVFVLLIHEYHTTTAARMRLQLKFWLVGMAIALPLGLTNLLPAYGVPIYPLGNLGSAAWAGIVAYAIVRHRLMDIDVVVSKGIAYFGVILLVVGPAFAAGIGLQRLAFGELHYDFSAGLLLLLLATGVLFPALQARVEARIERSLFPQKQASRATLASFARSIIRILDRERLVREFCGTLYEVFDLERISLFLVEDTRGRLELRGGVGPQPTSAYPADHPLARCLSHESEPLLAEELAAGSRGREWASIAELCRANRWEVLIPLLSGTTLVGFVGLGNRHGLQAFTAGDLDRLASVAAQASIAFENARLYDELRRSRDIINRAGRLSALGTLAAGIAHEIRNPLVSIRTFFQLAPQRLDDEEFMTSFLALAEAEVQRISNLISELLTFAKSPSTAVGEVDLDEIIDRTMTLLAPQAHKQQVEVVRGNCEGLPPVLADPDQVMQVLINIILNALQATPAGGTVGVEARVLETQSGPMVQIEIRDTGPGIPSEIREAIFNPFFTTKDKGTGLGLPIAHRIVAESGGFITVESVEGQGSRFSVHLPIVSPALAADAPLGHGAGS